MMKNKIMIEPGKAAKRRVNLAYARGLAAIGSALSRNTKPLYTEAEKTEIWQFRLFGRPLERSAP